MHFYNKRIKFAWVHNMNEDEYWLQIPKVSLSLQLRIFVWILGNSAKSLETGNVYGVEKITSAFRGKFSGSYFDNVFHEINAFPGCNAHSGSPRDYVARLLFLAQGHSTFYLGI